MNSPNVVRDIRTTLLACEREESRADFTQALEIVTTALARDGEHPALHFKRAQILMALRRRSDGFAAAERALEMAGPDPQLLDAVASIYIQSNDPGRAKPLVYRALERKPNDATLLYRAALCHFYLNETAQADDLLARMLEIAPGNGFAWHVRSQLATQTRDANHIAELRSSLARPGLQDVDEMLMSFSLARELEDVGEFAQSFDTLLQANRIKRRTLTYDVANDVRSMRSVMTHYSAEAMQALRGGDETPGAIFIVGMPRTGTTLVERMLGNHSAVASVGEAVDFPEEMSAGARSAHARLGLSDPNLLRASLQMDFGEVGRRYLSAVRQLAGGQRYTIDKLPFNFRYCGLIHQALPKAAIVHLMRDPMDTCYAVFRTLFINAYHFSYQLDEIAEYFIAYRRMMDHWHTVMPGVVLDVRYEELVADPQTQCRRLLQHCGLPWEDQVLDFHNSTKASTTASAMQVRRPIYKSSVQKWRNYARELQPVLQRLADAGLVDADGNPLIRMKLQYPFMQLPVSFDAAALAAEVGAIDESEWRPHPQGYAGNDALTLVTTGGDPDSDAVAGPMRATRHLERCPYLQQVLHSIGATWGRTRLMRLSGQAEVTPHVDVNYYWRERVRVHVPIVTQPTVRFTCGDAQLNMRAGECWIFDTWRMHNVVNDHALPRIHLVADTVGGMGFWQLVARARPHVHVSGDWQPQLVAPDPSSRPSLDFESENVPEVMTPWELRAHIAFALSEAVPHRNAPAIQQRLLLFVRDWHGLWSACGERREGWPRYRALLDAARRDLLAFGAPEIVLGNTVGLMQALDAWVFQVALADRRSNADPEVRQQPGAAHAPPVSSAAARRDPVFDRPVFIVSPPRSGSTMLFETLARAPRLFTIGDESHQLIEGVPQLSPESRGFESNRLLVADATPAVAETLRRRFYEALRDREGRRPPPAQQVRMLEKTPKNSLRVPFLARVFPEAHFIYLYRDPRQVLSSMIEAWTSGRFRTYPQLPGWTGAAWSLLLVPGWRELIGRPLHEIVAAQWNAATRLLIEDLEALPAERRTIARYDALVADPPAEIRRLYAVIGLEGDEAEISLRLSKYTVSAPDADKWRRHAAEIEAVLPGLAEQIARAERFAVR